MLCIDTEPFILIKGMINRNPHRDIDVCSIQRAICYGT